MEVGLMSGLCQEDEKREDEKRDDALPSALALVIDPTLGSNPASLSPTLASRTTIRSDPSPSSAGNPLGAPRGKLLWHGSPGAQANPPRTFMSGYSYRSATMGSTFVALRVGM
jgi:hypothetical protein